MTSYDYRWYRDVMSQEQKAQAKRKASMTAADSEAGAAFMVGFMFGGVAMALILFLSGAADTGPRHQREAIERGYAEYDAKTGNWQWIEPIKLEEDGCGQ